MFRRRSRPALPTSAEIHLSALPLEELERRTLLSAVGVTVDKTAVLEDGPPNLIYTFSRTEATIAPFTVNFQVSGSAKAGQDFYTSGATSFNGQTGTITFGESQTLATFFVGPINDPLVEPDENVQVTVTAGGGYTVGNPAGANALILNDDPSTTVTLTVESTSVAEDGNGMLRYTFTRAGNTVTDLTVGFRVTGTAIAGNDFYTSGATGFNGQVGTITIPSGQSSKVYFISPADDVNFEPNETVRVEITPGRFYSSGTPGSVQAQILDDDSAPVITVAVDSSSVAELGNGVLRYTFTRSGNTAASVTVNFRSVGAAVAGQDYYTSGATTFNGQTGTFAFAPGETSKVFLVSPIDDTEVEQSEDVLVNILRGTGYVSGDPSGASALIIIGDPSTTVTVTVDQSSIAEDGTGLLRYTFTRTGNTVTDLQVNFRVVGTAVAGQDFFTAGAGSFNGFTGVITIPAGQSSKVFLVSPADDGEVEEDESIGVEITPSNTYLAGTPAGAGAVILNDDPGPAPPRQSGSVAIGSVPRSGWASSSAPRVSTRVLPPSETSAEEASIEDLSLFTPPLSASIVWEEITERLLSGTIS